MRKQFTKQQTIEALLSDPLAILFIYPYRGGSPAFASIRVNIRNGYPDQPKYINHFPVRIDTARKIREAVIAGKYPTLKGNITKHAETAIGQSV